MERIVRARFDAKAAEHTTPYVYIEHFELVAFTFLGIYLSWDADNLNDSERTILGAARARSAAIFIKREFIPAKSRMLLDFCLNN
jgi:hypothetical protein